MHFTVGGGPQHALFLDSAASPQAASPQAASLVFSYASTGRSARHKGTLFASLALQRSTPPSRFSLLGFVASSGFSLLTGGRPALVLPVLQCSDAGLRKTWKSIDLDGKGHITEKDLEAFAGRSGLPARYAAHFMSAVRANHGAAGEGGAAEAQQVEDAELTFSMFRRFVRSREEALRRAFNMFDQDGDGRISVDDVDASLARVAVCCPKTRCIYRCRSKMAKHLYAKAAPEHGCVATRRGWGPHGAGAPERAAACGQRGQALSAVLPGCASGWVQ
ncbi:hypothetical protein TSOC_008619, partial [Tetrabaena socialis]